MKKKPEKFPLPRVEIFPGRNGRFYFRKVNRNGKKTDPSQGYKERRYAYEAAKRDVPGVAIVHLYVFC